MHKISMTTLVNVEWQLIVQSLGLQIWILDILKIRKGNLIYTKKKTFWEYIH